jgi:hypothetical protein
MFFCRLKATLLTIAQKQQRREEDEYAPELQDEEDPENVAVFLKVKINELRLIPHSSSKHVLVNA